MPHDSPISAADFKRLTSKRDRLTREIRALNESGQHTRERLKMEAELDGVNRKLERLYKGEGGAKGMVVTEHAMCRFVERVMLISPEDFAERVLPAALRAKLVEAGIRDGTVPVPVSPDSTEVSHLVEIRDGIVVSVLAAGSASGIGGGGGGARGGARGGSGGKPGIAASRVPRSITARIETDPGEQGVRR